MPDLLKRYRALADVSLAEYRHATRSLKEERVALRELRLQAKAAVEAQQILQKIALNVQNVAHVQIAKVVTHALKAVGWDYEFKINFERKRGKTEARLVFVRNGHEIDPTAGAGGGCVAVASFALRLVCIMLSTPKNRKLLVLDEPFSMVNGEIHREKVAAMIQSLAHDLSFQIIIATGLDWLRVGKVIEIGELS